MKSTLVHALAFVAFVGGAACSKKGAECEALVRVVNPAMEKMSHATAKKADKPAALAAQAKEIAAIAGGTASSLAKVALTVPELQAFSRDYQAMTREVAAAATETADAVGAAEVAQAAAEKADKESDEASTRLLKGCAQTKDASDHDVCVKVSELVKKLPDDLSVAPDLAAPALELEREPFRDPELQAAVKALAGALRTTARSIAGARSVAAKAKAAQAKFDAAAKQEDPLVDGVNRFCAR